MLSLIPGVVVPYYVAGDSIAQTGRARVTQCGLEVAVAAPTGSTTRVRATQSGIEAARQADPIARATQTGLEVARIADPIVRATQTGIEAARIADPIVRVTQTGLEVAFAPAALSVPLVGQLFPRGSPLPFPYT